MRIGHENTHTDELYLEVELEMLTYLQKQLAKQRWKNPNIKKMARTMVRNRIFLDETLQLPKEFAERTARYTVFGSKKVDLDIKYLVSI